MFVYVHITYAFCSGNMHNARSTQQHFFMYLNDAMTNENKKSVIFIDLLTSFHPVSHLSRHPRACRHTRHARHARHHTARHGTQTNTPQIVTSTPTKMRHVTTTTTTTAHSMQSAHGVRNARLRCVTELWHRREAMRRGVRSEIQVSMASIA